MSGSTCQFCGKPLWRIRRGSDGEFCSREHRNQYKLRMGLSQLAEADKLQGLRRRRDQCNASALFRAAGHPDVADRRSFPARRIAGDRPPAALSARRGGPPSPLLSAALGIHPVARLQPGPAGPRLAAAPPLASRAAVRIGLVLPCRTDPRLLAAFIPVRVPAADGGLGRPIFLIARFAPRRSEWKRISLGRLPGLPVRGAPDVALDGPVCHARPARRFAERPAAPSRPRLPGVSSPLPPVSVDAAGFVTLPPATPASRASFRSYDATARCPGLLPSTLPAARWLRIHAPGAPPLRPALPMVPAAPAEIGRSRLTAPLPGPITFLGCVQFRPVTQAWTGALPGCGPLPQAFPRAAARPAISIAPAAPPSPRRSPPSHRPAWSGSTRLFAPGAVSLRVVSRDAVSVRHTRAAAVPYPLPLACPALSAPCWSAGLREPAVRDSSPSPNSPIPARRPAAGPQPSRDPFFPPRAFSLQGELAEPLRSPAAAVLEDDFSAGLGLWSGGASSWKLDFAGVRPGTMAFFTPSLGLRDYWLEFLARIERGALTCAFRASGPDLHHGVRFAGAGMERYAVLDGRPEDPAASALPGVAGGKSLNVRIAVRGDRFSAVVNGREVDRWNDARLPSGGVGFSSGPDDRVRLYWVKVHPISPEISEQVSQP